MDSYKDVLTAHTNIQVMMLRAINDNMNESNTEALIRVFKDKWRTLVNHSLEQLKKFGFNKDEATLLLYSNCYFVGERGSVVFQNNTSCEVILKLETSDEDVSFHLELASRY